MDDNEKAVAELQQRRAVFVRSAQIIIKQLEHDALKMEESAIVDEHPIQRRHELMDLAKGIRQTTVWLTGLLTVETPKPESASN
jgi:hypothetical protein